MSNVSTIYVPLTALHGSYVHAARSPFSHVFALSANSACCSGFLSLATPVSAGGPRSSRSGSCVQAEGLKGLQDYCLPHSWLLCNFPSLGRAGLGTRPTWMRVRVVPGI